MAHTLIYAEHGYNGSLMTLTKHIYMGIIDMNKLNRNE